MAGNLSVGGVTGAINTAFVAKTDSPMTKLQKEKIELLRIEQETDKEILELPKRMLEMQKRKQEEIKKLDEYKDKPIEKEDSEYVGLWRTILINIR